MIWVANASPVGILYCFKIALTWGRNIHVGCWKGKLIEYFGVISCWKESAPNIWDRMFEVTWHQSDVTKERIQPKPYWIVESNLGTTVAQWLRCCATNPKVTGSIPAGVIGIFHWHNPSDRTMALGSDSASNRSEYQKHFLWEGGRGGKGGLCVKLTTLRLSCTVVMKSGSLNFLEPSGHVGPVIQQNFTKLSNESLGISLT